MKFNILGSTGLYVSELCLGAMTFGGKGFWEVALVRVQLANACALLTEHAHRQDDEALSGRFARNGYPSRTARRLRSVERTVPFRPAPQAGAERRNNRRHGLRHANVWSNDQTTQVLHATFLCIHTGSY